MPLSIGRIEFAAGVVIIVTCFVLDYYLPRDATAAIGYCGAVLLALDMPLPGSAVITAVLCTVLTWLGLLVDGWGDAFWMSAFDRVMVTGVIWLITITGLQRKRLSAQLAQRARELACANADLDRFVGIVSHDLRAPLTSMCCCMQVIEKEHAGTLN